MWRILSLVLVALVIVVFGFSLADVSQGDAVTASAEIVGLPADVGAFALATDTNYAWEFPRDHGAHPDFLTEWWYYTGNLSDAEGRRFGYQFTVFRRALTPTESDDGSEWRTRQAYLAHFTVSDIEGGQFYQDELVGRGAADLAGATVDPRYRVWIEDWEVLALDDDATQVQMRADAGDFAVDFILEQTKAPVLQGTNGLSQKGSEFGNASYYYSIPRMLTTGTLRIGDETFTVSGDTWMDREFSTSALSTNLQGWDWFGLIFDDGRELMLYQLRQTDGGKALTSAGLFVHADGTTSYLPSSSYTITATDTWRSSYSRATYPAGWQIVIDGATLNQSAPLTFTLTPLLADQELHSIPTYWEGAVRIGGDVSGYGYAELTGYVARLSGIF
ncbi:MAG: lipocalin-like domain-containing protein [Phototrophicaceae bacterium]|jgi:predicted secreted hydrolase